MIRLPMALITAILIAAGYNVIPNATVTNQVHLPIVIAPVAVCTPTPLEVTAVGTRLRRSELSSQYGAIHEGEAQWQVDGVRLSSHAGAGFSGHPGHGPMWIWNEVSVFCSASVAADAWSGLVDELKVIFPTRVGVQGLEEHRLEIGEQTYVLSHAERDVIYYAVLFRQGNVSVLVYIVGFEDVIDLETIESLADIIEARLEQ